MSFLGRLGAALGHGDDSPPGRGSFGTFAEWAGWLDEFAKGVDPDPNRLRPLAPTIGPHAMGRVADHAVSALSQRLQQWMANTDAGVSRARSLDAFRVSLQRGRDQLSPMVVFAHHPALPHTLAQALQATVRDTVSQVQRSMETQLQQSRLPGARPMLLAVRQAPLTAALNHGSRRQP